MKRSLIILFAVIALMLSCAKHEMRDVQPQTNEKVTKSTDAMVLLHSAEVVIYREASQEMQKAVGYIMVKNTNYNKLVAIRYQVSNDNNWRESFAQYHASVDGNYEIWKFETEGEIAHPTSPVFEFAIRYQVSGSEYWDNNNHNNYTLAYGTNPFILGSDTKVFGELDVFWYYGHYHVSFSAYVPNLAYHKNIELVYTSDNWATQNVLEGSYWRENPGQPGVEMWGASRYMGYEFNPQPGQTIEAAIVYRANGEEYWDNNFGANFVYEF
jgi:hypothetical protein